MDDLDDVFKAWEGVSDKDWEKFMYYTNNGWICPKCGRVYSPNTVECLYCNNNKEKSN